MAHLRNEHSQGETTGVFHERLTACSYLSPSLLFQRRTTLTHPWSVACTHCNNMIRSCPSFSGLASEDLSYLNRISHENMSVDSHAPCSPSHSICTLYPLLLVLLNLTACFSVPMLKVTSPNVSPSKKKKCPVCQIKYHIHGFSSHVKKCERECQEHHGDKRYLKELKKKLRAAAHSEADAGMSMIYQTCIF